MLASQLNEIIEKALDTEIYSNVVFYAEKLLCEKPNDEKVKYWLAKGYVGEGKYHKAFQILKRTKSSECRYLYTQVCLKLNKFIEAEKALVTDKYFSKGVTNKDIEKVIPKGAAGYFLLGIVMEKMERSSDAFNAYKRSLELDPFMWSSYEKLCKLDPTRVDNKIFTELNPKILIFNKKFLDNNNKGQNSSGSNIGNFNNNNNFSNKQTKDFLLSPDDNNNLKENNNSIQRCYGTKKNKKNMFTSSSNNDNNLSNEDLNKYRTFLDFNNTTPNQSATPGLQSNNASNNVQNNVSNVNMTPVVHKDNSEYNSINYENNQIPRKNNQNNPFVFSSSPHQIQLEFASGSGESKKSGNASSNLANLISGGGNNSSSGFHITNVNATSNTNTNNNISEISNSRINPFNVSGMQQSSFNDGSRRIDDGGHMETIPEHPNFENTNKLFENIHLNIPINLNNTFALKQTGEANKLLFNNRGDKSSLFSTPLENAKKGNDLQTPQNLFAVTSSNKDNNLNNINNNNAQNKPQQLPKQTLPQFQITNNSTASPFQNICQLLKYYAEILKKLALYECQDAISLLLHLPQCYKDSAYTNATLGRCYFELGKYKEAEKFYHKALQIDPSHLEGLEYFSSALWHLKDQYQCCNLAYSAIEQSMFCPETWIVVGNCFSLQKEHEIAIKFFNRATQINPACAYAYTLCGHEYVSNENYTMAEKCYKSALKFDIRSFNAWWGLGQIQLKQQNYSEAIKHFKKALTINTKSALLHFYLATAHLHNRDLPKALNYLQQAEKLDDTNPMFKFQISNILINQGNYDEALKILNSLDQKMPKEAPIHIEIGKIYQFKKDYQKALDHFNIAIDLDPKDSNLAKSLIERLYNESGNDGLFPNK